MSIYRLFLQRLEPDRQGLYSYVSCSYIYFYGFFAKVIRGAGVRPSHHRFGPRRAWQGLGVGFAAQGPVSSTGLRLFFGEDGLDLVHDRIHPGNERLVGRGGGKIHAGALDDVVGVI